MSEFAIDFDQVWKKFKKGEIHDSLRDLIPAVASILFSRKHRGELEKQEFWALKNVSFQVRRGEALGIIGPNGAGKSTILKLLCGILRPTQGAVSIHGRLSALIEVGAGFHPDLTGRENTYLNGAILGMKRNDIDKKLDEIIAFSGLEDFIDTPVKRYSSGMYARLGFSVAAHVNPEVLLVDEVLSVGDFPFQLKCLQRMKETLRKGTTVVYISHNVPSVIDLCPRAILLRQGQIQKSGPAADVSRFYYRAFAETHRSKSSIELQQSDLLSEEGVPSSVFRAGKWARIQLTVSSSEGVRDLIAGFFIKRSDGLLLFDTNSERNAGTYYSFEPGETRVISIDFRLNLPNGTYFLGTNFSKTGEGFYMYEDEIVEFQVVASMLQGYLFVDTKWQ
jgi:lipopolysaccharide transport system ATP-binding protein